MDDAGCSTATTCAPVPTTTSPTQTGTEDPEASSGHLVRRHHQRVTLAGPLPPTPTPPQQQQQQQRPRHQRRSLSSQSTLTHRHRRQAPPAPPQRSLQDMQNEQSYLLQHLQRHDERARALLTKLADVQSRLLQPQHGDNGGGDDHDGRRAQKDVRLLKNKMLYNEQQERATLGRLGDLYVEMQARERWCCVLQEHHVSGHGGEESMGWPSGSPFGWVQGALPVMLSPLSPGFDAAPMTPLSPLSPCFVPGAYFDEEFREEEAPEIEGAAEENDQDQQADDCCHPASDNGHSQGDCLELEDIEQAAPVKGRTRSLSLSTSSPDPPARRLSLQFAITSKACTP